MTDLELVDSNLTRLLDEMASQSSVGEAFDPSFMSFDDHMRSIREYIDAGEAGLAYELIICLLEEYPFVITGPTIVGLVEVALIFGYKTERGKDARFRRDK